MNIGYSRALTQKESQADQQQLFEGQAVDEFIFDNYHPPDSLSKPNQLMKLIARCQPGDTVIILTLERLSCSYVTLIDLFTDFYDRQVTVKVQAFPSMGMEEWLNLLNWWQENEVKYNREPKIISVGKEELTERDRIRAFSKDAFDRQLYWKIFNDLIHGASLRKTAKLHNVSKATVLRIKREITKLKQVLWLISVFIMTVLCLKTAQYYSDNWVIQLIICMVATISIIFFTYSDMKEP